MGPLLSKEDVSNEEGGETVQEASKNPACDYSAYMKKTDCKAGSCDYSNYILKTEHENELKKYKNNVMTEEKMYKEALNALATLGTDEDKKKKVIDALFYYKEFKNEKKYDTVDNAIESVLGALLTYAQDCYNIDFKEILATYRLTQKTGYNTTSKKCENDTKPDTTLIYQTLREMILGVEAFMAIGLLHQIWHDAKAEYKDSTKNEFLFYNFITSEAGGKVQVSTEKVNKLLSEKVKPVLDGLHVRLFSAFWLPRIISMNNDDTKNKLLDVLLTETKGFNLVNADENNYNLTVLVHFLYFYQLRKQTPDTSNQFNQFCDCYFGQLADKIANNDSNGFKNLHDNVKSAAKCIYGGMMKKEEKWELGNLIDDVEMKDMIATFETDKLHATKLVFGVKKSESFVMKNARNEFEQILFVIIVLVVGSVCLFMGTAMFKYWVYFGRREMRETNN